ncbi:hypothetical protein NUSPORA_00694 [Nucleospora cyclopteri]
MTNKFNCFKKQAKIIEKHSLNKVKKIKMTNKFNCFKKQAKIIEKHSLNKVKNDCKILKVLSLRKWHK